MKLLILMPLALVLAVALIMAGPTITAEPVDQAENNQPPLLGRITELSELVTLRVPVSELRATTISGYTGTISCLLLVHGDVELGIDLDKARLKDVDPKNRTATVVLPEPTPRRARLDHRRTKVYRIDRTGLWHIRYTDEKARRVVNQAYREAQVAVERAGQDEKLRAQARRRAEEAIRGSLKAMGWEVSISWRG